MFPKRCGGDWLAVESQFLSLLGINRHKQIIFPSLQSREVWPMEQTDMNYFQVWSLKTSHPQSFMLFPLLQAVCADRQGDLREPCVEDSGTTSWREPGSLNHCLEESHRMIGNTDLSKKQTSILLQYLRFYGTTWHNRVPFLFGIYPQVLK